MRVLIVNTSERAGGAAVAAGRLMEALKNNGVKAKMLVRDKQTDQITVCALPRPRLARWHFLWERWCIFWHLRFKRDHLFDIDTASSGSDITRLPEFKEADIIHLHWINQGMLSMGGIKKILRSGKPVVWTMHDMWPATAICHLTLGCHKFHSGCAGCKYLPGSILGADLAARVWRKKGKLYREGNLSFVTCSRWLAAEAKSSALLKGHRVTAIPNPIDTRLYHPRDRHEARERAHLPLEGHIILFIAQSATDPYKGMDYLIEACRRMAADHPETVGQTHVAILGRHCEEYADGLPYPTLPMGYVGDDHTMADIYAGADLFVLPSLSENLPNTIMEAMACGVPCVGFRVGGIPEMIDHRRNGYVAAYRDAADLAAGMYWTLFEADREALSRQAVHKVATNYSQQSVAMRYIEVYNEMIAMKRYIR